MKRLIPVSAAVVMAFVVFLSAVAGAQSTGALERPLAFADTLPSGPVYVIPIRGTIDLGLSQFVRRSVEEARQEGAGLIVVEIDTFGGRVDAATEIRDVLLTAGVRTVAFVNGRAWSAGALIALACEKIALAPGAGIGAAEPRPADEKTVSALRAEFEATASRYGRDRTVAGAMVDANISIPDLVEEGEILTLAADTAVEIGFVEGVVPDRGALLAGVDAQGRRVVEVEMGPAELVARFLSDPTVSQILLSLGMLGLLAEITSPGWGIPGFAGLAAIGLFFGARLIAGLAGLESVLLFFLGMVLILVEFFVIPGFGVAGVSGLVAVASGLYLAFPDPGSAIQSIGVALLVSILFGVLLFRFARRRGAWERFILRSGKDLAVPAAPEGDKDLVGREGTARTPLRPAGIVDIDGERYDAVTEGAFVESGGSVRVVEVRGSYVVVRPQTTT